MTNIKNILRTALKSTLNETLESKADKLIEKIQKMEMDEILDDPSIDEPEVKTSRDVMSKFFQKGIKGKGFKPRGKEFGGSEMDDYKRKEKDDEGMELAEGEMCECGSGMYEAECTECGSMRESLYKQTKPFGKKTQEFDYIAEEDDMDFEVQNKIEGCKASRELANQPGADEASKQHAEDECSGVEHLIEGKKLVGNQKKLDKNKNNKIDSEDFKLLRKSKKTSKKEVEEDEMEEGNAFTSKLAKARKGDKFSMNGKTYTDTSDYDVNESVIYHITDNQGDTIKLNEEEMIDLIENIVSEEKIKGLKTIGKPKGLTVFEKAHKSSGKENDDYLKSVTKKMKDYLKDGSKGKYDMNPKMFPAGNGELAKMDKKAFKLSDDLEDFNYEIAGQNFPVPDAINYNEEWMEKLFKGDSMTGNAPGGNALESKTNDRFNKMRKKNTLKKLKDQSYKRVPQPVFNEKTGTESGKGLNIKLESENPKELGKINEEFDRIKELLSYDRKTQ
jgi:hypothetical protein